MKLKQKILIGLGFLFLLLGAIGIFLPVLPTTPFVLLASACFSSSKRLTLWLKKSKVFGEYITNYQERNGLKRSTVIKSLSFLWIMLILSMVLIAQIWSVILLTSIGSIVTIHILIIAKPKEKPDGTSNLEIQGN